MRAFAITTVLALAACSPKAADGSQAPAAGQSPAAATAADYSQPMIARGNEPFWAVKIDGATFTLSRPDQPDTVFEAPGAQIVPNKAVWQAKAADGRTMTVTLYTSDCSDGMSDARYPMAAEVELEGERLGGCAAKASELPQARPAAG